MIDILLEESWGEYGILNVIEIRSGQKIFIESFSPIDYEKAFKYVTNRYDFARILCGNAIK